MLVLVPDFLTRLVDGPGRYSSSSPSLSSGDVDGSRLRGKGMMVDVGGGMRIEGDAIYGIDDIMYFSLVVRGMVIV